MQTVQELTWVKNYICDAINLAIYLHCDVIEAPSNAMQICVKFAMVECFEVLFKLRAESLGSYMI